MRKRIFSLFTLFTVLVMALTPSSAFALDGCDGVMDTGEIELESYIEWNTFKSNVDGLSEEALEELRSAEDRGILPEMYPVGTNKVVIKTDIGFYPFLIASDGSYVSLGEPLRYAHVGSDKDNYVGTDAVSGGANTYSCCKLTGVTDYGYYGDDFYAMFSNSTKAWDLDSTDVHSKVKKQSTYSSSDAETGSVLFKLSASDADTFKVAFHGYSNSGSGTGGSKSTYWGDTSLFSVANVWDDDTGYDETYHVMEYDFSKGLLNQTPDNATVVNTCKPWSSSVSAISGRFSANRVPIKLDRDAGYPYGRFKFGAGRDTEDYIFWDYIYGWYDGDDNGVRTVTPLAGFVNSNDRLHGTRNYYRLKSSGNADDVGKGGVYTAWNIGKNVGPTQVSVDQVEQLSKKLAAACNKNGIPFYAVSNMVRKNMDYSSADSVYLYSTRLSSTHTDGKTYHDGRLRLYKPAKPTLGTDGKYVLGQTTTHYVSGGMGKNATRLTFNNISLGSDAKIEIYGVTYSGGNTLIETITNSKNSVGTYTTPTYPYGEVMIKFTGGTSTSGRGEGFVLSKAEHGKFGVINGDYTVENVGKISVPKVGYSGLTEAKYPSNGSTTHSTSIHLGGSSHTSGTKLLQSNVFVEGNKTFTYTSTNNGTTKYFYPGYYSNYVTLKNTVTGESYNLTTSSSSFSTSFTGPSGYYDVYGTINGGNTTRADYYITLGGTEYLAKSQSEDRSVASNGVGVLNFDGLEVETYTIDASTLTTATSQTLVSEVTLNKGDTVEIRIQSSNTYVSGTNASWQTDLHEPGYTSDLEYGTSITKYPDSTTRSHFVLNNSYENKVMDIKLYNSNQSNSTYQVKSGDNITVNIYRRTLIDTEELTGDTMKRTTASTYIYPADTSYNTAQYMYYDVYLKSGGSTTSSAYRIYLSGSTYYLSNYSSGSNINYINTSNYSIYYWCYSESYYDYISSDTTIRINAYDTAFRRLQSACLTKLGTANVKAPVVSGYTNSNVVAAFELPAVAATWKLVQGEKLLGSSTTTASESKTLSININSQTANSGVDLYVTPLSSEVESIPVRVTGYYYDTAGTEYKRYGRSSATNLNYYVTTLDAHFINIKIKEFNVPDGMKLYVKGVQVTSAPYESGWTNQDNVLIQLFIPATGDYGAFELSSMAEVIDYEVQTKSIYDATSKTSHTGVNLNQFQQVQDGTYSDGDPKYICQYDASTSITAATNAYVKIVSSLGLPIYNSSSRCGITGTISGLRGLSSINANNYDTESFGDTGYLPTSSSTITLSFTNVEYTTYSSNFYCPTGYAIKDWYMIQASNIPDSKIKTYKPGYQTIATGSTKFGDVALKELADAGHTKVQVHSNVPIVKSNYEDYSSGNYSGTKTFGEMYYTTSNGTETLAGKWNTQTINPNSYKYFRFKDTTKFSATSVNSSVSGTPSPTWTKYIGENLYYYGIEDYDDTSWNYYLPLIHINGAEIPGTCYNTALTDNTTVSSLYNTTNPAKGSDGTAGGSFKLTMWTGDTQFEDGRYGVAKLGQDIYYSSQWYSTVQRVDVYRDYADGTKRNIAMIPVGGTETYFITTGGINGINEEPPSVYHIGNDLMYIPGNAVDARTDGNAGISMAWLRTGHWHLKGNPSEIEGIVPGGVQNPVKSMDDDASADTQIIESELDMNAESWKVGHKIKDGRVTEEKLSDDVKDKINEINLGTITLIKDDGAQYKMIPVRNVYESGVGYIEDCTLSYGGKEILMFSSGTDQIGVSIEESVIESLSNGSYVFKGTTTQGDREINVVLQVNIIERPSVDTTTTIEF